MSCTLRAFASRDLPYIKDIEDVSFECPWEMTEFRDHIRKRNGHLLVAEMDRRVVGYMCYTANKNSYEIDNLCVPYESRRQGVGTKLIDNLKMKMNRGNTRNCISLVVADYNLGAHLFLKNRGFIAQGVLDDYFSCDESDGYMFEFTLHPVAIPIGGVGG